MDYRLLPAGGICLNLHCSTIYVIHRNILISIGIFYYRWLSSRGNYRSFTIYIGDTRAGR